MYQRNRVILTGRIGRSPENGTLPNGDPVCNLSLATSEFWKDRNSGERREKTEWHRCVLYRNNAEYAKSFQSGDPLDIEGKLTTREWQDAEGKRRFTVEVEVIHVNKLEPRPTKPRELAPADNDDVPPGEPF